MLESSGIEAHLGESRLTDPAWDAIRQIFGPKDHELRFGSHVIHSSVCGRKAAKNDGYFPMSRSFIKKNFKTIYEGGRIDAYLENDGVYSKAAGKCLYYRVREHCLLPVLDANESGVRAGMASRRWNFRRESRSTVQPLPHQADEKMVGALRELGLYPVWSRGDLARLRGVLSSASCRWDRDAAVAWIGACPRSSRRDVLRRACAVMALGTMATATSAEGGAYSPRYQFGWGDRAYEVGIGAQGMPSSMKAACLLGKNHDMKAAHPRLARMLMTLVGDHDGAEMMTALTDCRQELAAEYGLPVEAVKLVANAALNGGRPDSTPSNETGMELRAEVEGFDDERHMPACRAIADAVARSAVPLARRFGVKHLGEVLATLESSFMRALVLRAAEAGVGVESLQHDGLLTVGELPESIWQAAAEDARLTGHVQVVQKPF